MSTILQIADSVTAKLNASSLSMPLAAERHYVPNFELTEMKVLRVSVVPRELLIAPHDRASNRYDAKIDVAVQRKFSKGDPAEIDPLLYLCEEIIDLFRMKRLDSMPEARCISVEHPVIYSVEHWEQLRQFTSLLTFTFQLAR